MRTITTVSDLRSALGPHRRQGQRVGLVPTMGAFHEGHLSLIRRARADCQVVVVSLFVNPKQFNDPGDLSAYPREESRDGALAADLGVDVLFMPSTEEVYPAGFATSVRVGGLTDRLEGEHRGQSHFDGVTTVVTKLFNMVAPDVAYFGQKDAQQTIVIKRLVRDLDLPVQIEVCPTIREPDGLAMSSRNVHLSPADRERALALQRALHAVEESIAAGERDPEAAITAGLDELSAVQVEPDYLELVATDTLAPVQRIDGDVLAVIAARVGNTRLIDNHTIKLQIIKPDHEVATPAGAPTA
jgi:pantoate--beta-alanine ligase